MSPGEHQLAFELPAGVPPSYPGTVAQVVHLVRAVPAGRESASSNWALTRVEELLVVLP